MNYEKNLWNSVKTCLQFDRPKASTYEYQNCWVIILMPNSKPIRDVEQGLFDYIYELQNSECFWSSGNHIMMKFHRHVQAYVHNNMNTCTIYVSHLIHQVNVTVQCMILSKSAEIKYQHFHTWSYMIRACTTIFMFVPCINSIKKSFYCSNWCALL